MGRAESLVMTNKALTITLALVAGFLGGTLSRYATPTVAFAEAQSTAPKEIRAQRFTLVDENGTVRGVFAITPVQTNDQNQKGGGDAVIKLYDGSGREVFSAGAPAGRLVGQR
jgi:hypothetical protein